MATTSCTLVQGILVRGARQSKILLVCKICVTIFPFQLPNNLRTQNNSDVFRGEIIRKSSGTMKKAIDFFPGLMQMPVVNYELMTCPSDIHTRPNDYCK